MNALYLLKYVLKLQSATFSILAKDGVATFEHAGGILQLIVHASFVEKTNYAHEITKAVHPNAAVKLPLLVAQANHHCVTSEFWVDFLFNALEQGGIVIQELDARDKCGFHQRPLKKLFVLVGNNSKYAGASLVTVKRIEVHP